MSSDNESIINPVDIILEEEEEQDIVQEEGEIFDEILQENRIEEAGPKLPDKVHNLMKVFLGNKEVLKNTPEKLKSVLVPEGAEFLAQSRINNAVYPLLSPSLKRQNSEALKLESAITKSAIIQAEVMQQILEIKKLLPASQAGLVNDSMKQIAKSIEILGFGRIKLNENRRSNIVASLNPGFKRLLTETSPGEGLLFGNSLGDALKEIESANKMTARLSGNNVEDDYNISNNNERNYNPATTSQARGNRNSSFLGRGQASSRKRHIPRESWSRQQQYGKRPFRQNPPQRRRGNFNQR
jgi:hypothetical protein